MNVTGIVRVIGFLLIVEALFMLVPTVVAVYYGERDYYAFAVGAILTGLCGGCMWGWLRDSKRDLGKRDGFLLTALVWVVFSLFGVVPLMFSSMHLSFTDAFTETMSGFTTTGCTVFKDVEELPRSIHIWRSLMQWIGGMGIILFTLAVLPALNSSGGMQLMSAEVTGITQDKIQPRVSETAKRLWLIYLLLTVAVIVLLCFGPMSIFEGICHGLSTISTGGFSTRNASLMAWNSPYINVVTMCFMFLGGVNFALIYRMSTGRFRSSWRDESFRTYVKIIVVISLVILLINLINNGFNVNFDEILFPFYQVVSAITSTGYVASEWTRAGTFVFPVLVIVMAIGACAGSTSGGAKIDRINYVWKNTLNEIRRCIFSRRVYAVTINGKAQSPEIVNKVMAFLWVYFGLIIAGGIILAAMGLPVSDSLFASLSCMANTGVGTGITADSIAMVPDAGKWLLSAMMLIGRLEIFTVLVLFMPSFWR